MPVKMPPAQLALRLHQAAPGRAKEWGGLSKGICAPPAPSACALGRGAVSGLCPAGCWFGMRWPLPGPVTPGAKLNAAFGLGGLLLSEATPSTEQGEPGWGDGSSHPIPSHPAPSQRTGWEYADPRSPPCWRVSTGAVDEGCPTRPPALPRSSSWRGLWCH